MVHITALFLNNEIRTGGHRRYLELLEDLSMRGNCVSVVMNDELSYTPISFKPIRISCAYRKKAFLRISRVFRTYMRKSWPEIKNAIPDTDILMIHGETHLSSARFIKHELGVPLFYAHRSNSVREMIVAMAEKNISVITRARLFAGYLQSRRHEREITKHCDRIAFQSPFDMNDFCARNPGAESKSCVIRGNIGLPRFTEETRNKNVSTRLRKIAFVGTLGNRKGVRHLFRAIELLAQDGITDLSFEIVGPGDSLERWKAWVTEKGLTDRVFVRGRVKDPFSYIIAADLMIIPSDFDSYPDTVLESLHCGTPVLGSSAGGIPDMLQHEDLLFPVQDPEAIAERIKALYLDDARYLQIKSLCASRREAFVFDWAAAWEAEIMKTEAPDSRR